MASERVNRALKRRRLDIDDMRSVTAKADGNRPPEWHGMPRCRLTMASSNEVPKPSPELRLRPSQKREGDSRCELIWKRVRRFEMWVMVKGKGGHATRELTAPLCDLNSIPRAVFLGIEVKKNICLHPSMTND